MRLFLFSASILFGIDLIISYMAHRIPDSWEILLAGIILIGIALHSLYQKLE